MTTAKSIQDLALPLVARWGQALPVHSEGESDSLKMVYESRGEFMTYTAAGGYCFPFNSLTEALKAI